MGAGRSKRRAIGSATALTVAVAAFAPGAVRAAVRNPWTAAAVPHASVTAPIGGIAQAFAGDFDGDGRDDVVQYQPGAAPDDVEYGTATRGVFTRKTISVFGHYRPFVGDFDGDGRADVYWYDPHSGTESIWLGQANRTFVHHSLAAPARGGGAFYGSSGDFNCDGRTDILWYGPGAKRDYVFTSTGPLHWRWTGVAIDVLADLRVGDFNGDRCDDVLVYTHGAPGAELLFGSPFSGFTPHPITQTRGYVPVVGNFEGCDHRYLCADIMWYAPGTPAEQAWYSRFRFEPFTFERGGGHVNGTYRPVAGDFDGDGQTDILWVSPTSTHSTIWFDVRRDLIATGGVRWVRETGGANQDVFQSAAAAPDGTVYVAGHIDGPPSDDARPAVDATKAIIVKYAPDGVELWRRTLTGSGATGAMGVAVDRHDNAYVTGWSAGHITGSPESTGGVFVAEYAADGARKWVHQISGQLPVGIAVSPDGLSYVVGQATDGGFLAAFLPLGGLHWRHGSLPQLEYGGGGVAVARDDGPVMAAGPVVAHYNASGALEWGHWLGTSSNGGAAAVAVDRNDRIDIVGDTTQLPGAPEPTTDGRDPFIVQLDDAGNQIWAHRFRIGPSDSYATAVATNARGDAFMAGWTNTLVPGAIEGNDGDYDPFLAKFDSAGVHAWSHELGSTGFDLGLGVAALSTGQVAMVGGAGGVVPPATGPFLGGDFDAFIALF